MRSQRIFRMQSCFGFDSTNTRKWWMPSKHQSIGNKGAETRANETKLFPLAFYRGRRLYLFYFFFLFCIWSVGRSLMHILHFCICCAPSYCRPSLGATCNMPRAAEQSIIGVWYDDDGCRCRRRRHHHRYDQTNEVHTQQQRQSRRKYAELQISRWLCGVPSHVLTRF